MTANENEIVEAVLNGFRIFVSWPVLALVLVMLFRKQISELLSAIESISIGDKKIRFFKKEAEKFAPELQEQVMSKVSARYLIEGEDDELEGLTTEAEEPISRGELDESGETKSSDIDKWEQTLDDLENR